MFATADYNQYCPDEDQYPDEEDGQATSPRVVYDRTNLPRGDDSSADSSKPQQRRVPQQQPPGGDSGGRARTPPEHATQPQSEQGQPRGGGSAEGASARGVRERELPSLDPRGRFRSR